MPLITLPDNSKRDFKRPITIEELALDIGPELGKSAVAGKVDGVLVDARELHYEALNRALKKFQEMP